jgi:hypothetical protein
VTEDPDITPAREAVHRRLAAQGGMGMRVWLAVFVAQGLWGLVMLLAMVAAAAAALDTTQAVGSGDIIGWLVAGMDGLAGSSATVLRATFYVLAAAGLLLLVGALVVPALIRIFVRVVCDARVGYGWALVANLASSVLLVALTLLLWFIPGAQPIAAFICWIGSSLLTALLVQLRMRPLGAASPALLEAPVLRPVDSTDTPDPIHREA